MSDKNEFKEVSNRINSVIRSVKIKCTSYWANQLGVTKQMVRNWLSDGKIPNSKNLIRLCELEKISANWLLLGVGPKDIEAADNKDFWEQTEKHKRTSMELVLKKNKQIKELKKELEAAEEEISALKQRQKIYDAFDTPDESKTYFRQNVLPLLSLIRLFQNAFAKYCEMICESKHGTGKMASLFDWIENNLEKEQFTMMANLSDLQSLKDIDMFKTDIKKEEK